MHFLGFHGFWSWLALVIGLIILGVLLIITSPGFWDARKRKKRLTTSGCSDRESVQKTEGDDIGLLKTWHEIEGKMDICEDCAIYNFFALNATELYIVRAHGWKLVAVDDHVYHFEKISDMKRV